MGDIGFSEMLVILVVAIIAFGKDLPMVVRKVGRMVGKARRYLLDIKDEVQRQLPIEDFDVRQDIRNVQSDVDKAVEDSTYHPPSDPEPPPPAPEPPKAEPEAPAAGPGPNTELRSSGEEPSERVTGSGSSLASPP